MYTNNPQKHSLIAWHLTRSFLYATHALWIGTLTYWSGHIFKPNNQIEILVNYFSIILLNNYCIDTFGNIDQKGISTILCAIHKEIDKQINSRYNHSGVQRIHRKRGGASNPFSATTSRPPFQMIIINDNSPELAVRDYLTAFSANAHPDQPRVIYLENRQNLGFVASVNRGIRQNSENDVILLNSGYGSGQ